MTASSPDSTHLTTLDLVDQLIGDAGRHGATELGPRLTALRARLFAQSQATTEPELLNQTYQALTTALGGIRQGRATLQHNQFARIDTGQQKLSEVSLATESATTELLNGLDRSLALMDRLEGTLPSGSDAAATLTTLRDGTHQLFSHLQFQDITAQQLAGVGHLLDDIEARVAAVVTLLEDSAAIGVEFRAPVDPAAYNPEATFSDVAERQARIDAAFGRPHSGNQAQR